MEIKILGYKINVEKDNTIELINGKISVNSFGGNKQDKGYYPGDKTTLHIHGNISGNVHTDMSINCNDVRGYVQAGGSVNCDDIGGNLAAQGSVNCDDVGGSIAAKGSVVCS